VVLSVRTAATAIVLVGLGVALTGQALSQYAGEEGVVFLEQGWSHEDRLLYYNTSQGSAAISYDIFLNLERAGDETLFRSDENMVSYGFVPQPPDPTYNPDGVPIGVTKTIVPDGPWKGEWAGLGCAACHNGQLEFQGTKIRISGGNANTLDIMAFIAGLDAALAATVADPAKFQRLAEKLGQEGDAADLRGRLEQDASVMSRYLLWTAATPVAPGPGRMDALGLIHNQVTANILGVRENWRSAVAPVKPSFVWNLPQAAWAQWSGVLKDPVLRNVGEVMGVFARIDLSSPSPDEGLFDSTLDLAGQLVIEDLLRRLAPPQWPEEIFGEIDREKAALGKQLFSENCAGCHSTWPHRWSEAKKQGKRFIENAIVSNDLIGADATQFGSPQFELRRPTVFAGPMSPHLDPPFTGALVVPPPEIFAPALRGIYDKAVAKLNLTDEELVAAHGYRAFYPEELEPIPALFAYKANPAEGMWSSPPFLHNGSVPNLYELLSPAGERSRSFFIGRDFDPVKVGIDTSGATGKFLYDTTLVGNANSGHSFEDGPIGNGVIGRLLSDEERWALIEYMKSIPEEPAQVTPFGGPENPVQAWADPTFYHVVNPGTYNGAPDLGGNQTPQPRKAEIPALGQETVDPSEAAFIEFIVKETINRLSAQFPEGTQPVLRDAHPKTHLLLRGEFVVLDDLPPELRYGVFKEARTFDALIRFSAGGIEVQSDAIPQANGMAIKLFGVEGEKLLAAEKDAETQDFVMINNFPSFFVRNLADYQKAHEALGLQDPAAGLAAFFRDHPEEARAVAAMRGTEPLDSPFAARYWSQTPFSLGPLATKFSVNPIFVPASSKPRAGDDFLRDVGRDQIGSGDVYFEFLVQVQVDPVAMPVEDSLVIWDEAQAPFQRVAIIRIPKQDVDIARSQMLAETLSFNPWHSLPEHQPIGSINRARKAIYEALAEFRHARNGTVHREPTEIPF